MNTPDKLISEKITDDKSIYEHFCCVCNESLQAHRYKNACGEPFIYISGAPCCICKSSVCLKCIDREYSDTDYVINCRRCAKDIYLMGLKASRSEAAMDIAYAEEYASARYEKDTVTSEEETSEEETYEEELSEKKSTKESISEHELFDDELEEFYEELKLAIVDLYYILSSLPDEVKKMPGCKQAEEFKGGPTMEVTISGLISFLKAIK